MSPDRALRLLPLILVVAFTGCAQMPGSPSGPDPVGLNNAIVADHVDYVKAAVRSGFAQVNQRIPAPAYAEGTPLITIAARAGSLEVLRYLIFAGADINARTPANETPLMLAAYFFGADRLGTAHENHEKSVRMLVERGAELENEPHNYTPLSYAAYQGHENVVRYLLERGARVDGDARDGITYVNTPLMMAAMQGHRETALLLLRAGANARVRVYQGATAAELAARHQGGHLLGFLRCAERLAPGETFVNRCDGAANRRAMESEVPSLRPVSFDR